MTRADLKLGDPAMVNVAELVVLNFAEPFMPAGLRCGLHPELRAAQQRAATALAGAGAELRQLTHADLPEASEAFSIWSSMLEHANEVEFAEILYDYRADRTPGSLGLLVQTVLSLVGFGWSRHTVPAAALSVLEKLTRAFPAESARLRRKGAALKARLDGLLAGPSTVLLLPSILAPAPRHHENVLRFTSTSQTGLLNVMELPVTAVPAGVDSSGALPLGYQVAAAEGNDHLTIAVAIWLEERGVASSPTPGGDHHS